MSEVAVIEPEEFALQKRETATPMEMLAAHIEGGADPAVLDKLMTLQERWQANQGRAAFDQAMADAKSEIKPITKSATGYGYTYEDMAAIARHVDPILAACGLSYRFRTDQDDKRVSVTCVISHRDGHFEETTLRSAPDDTGSKNDIQAIGSAVTYLQRYTLKAALGLSAAKDDDGNSVPRPSERAPQPAPQPQPAPAPKGQSRELFGELQKSLRECDSKASLQAWGAGNRNRILTLPVDWADQIRTEYKQELEGHLAVESGDYHAAQ